MTKIERTKYIKKSSNVSVNSPDDFLMDVRIKLDKVGFSFFDFVDFPPM